MQVYLNFSSVPSVAVYHDGVMVGGRPVAACNIGTWGERAEWAVAPANTEVTCPRCLMLRQLTEF